MSRVSPGKFITTLELDGEEVEVTVEYNYTPGTPDVRYLSNGDPGYPGDPDEAEVTRVYRLGDKTKTDLRPKLTEETLESLCEEACVKGCEAEESAYEDAMEAKADCAREEAGWDD